MKQPQCLLWLVWLCLVCLIVLVMLFSIARFWLFDLFGWSNPKVGSGAASPRFSKTGSEPIATCKSKTVALPLSFDVGAASPKSQRTAIAFAAEVHLWRCTRGAVSSHNFNSLNVKLRVSNPRAIAYAHLKVPFESSDLPGAGPIFPDSTFENWPQPRGICERRQKRPHLAPGEGFTTTLSFVVIIAVINVWTRYCLFTFVDWYRLLLSWDRGKYT